MMQKNTIGIILFLLSLILACTSTNASPLKNRAPGQVVFCDFVGEVSGRVTFTELAGKVVRELGQLNTGFPDRTSLYQFRIVSEPLVTIDPDLISPPGVKPYQIDYTDTDVSAFIKKAEILRNGKVVGTCDCKLVGQ